MPVRYEHDASILKGRLRYRAAGPVLTDHEPFDAKACSECGCEAAEPLDATGARYGCRACGVVEIALAKILPCANARCEGQAKLPGGAPYTIGKAPSQFPFTYSCAGCGLANKITATDWGRLPDYEPEEYVPQLDKRRQRMRSERKTLWLHQGLPKYKPPTEHASGVDVKPKEEPAVEKKPRKKKR